MKTPHHGSCLCGKITFEIKGEPGELGHCHCKMCQKAHGTGYATFVNVTLESFVFTQGIDHLSEYNSSQGIKRTFCRNCGASLQFVRDDAESIGVAAGCFDSDIGGKVDYEIWTASAADWGHRANIKHRFEADK